MNNIASERTRIGITQKDLAKKLDKSLTTVSRWEQGRGMPTASELIGMHKLFGCSVDYLLGLSDERTYTTR